MDDFLVFVNIWQFLRDNIILDLEITVANW